MDIDGEMEKLFLEEVDCSYIHKKLLFDIFQQNENNIKFPPPTDSKRILLLELEHNSFNGVEGKVVKFC